MQTIDELRRSIIDSDTLPSIPTPMILRQGEVVGVRTLTLNASHTFIPLASGALSAALGMAPVFVLLAAGLLTGAWFSRQQVK